VIAPGPEPVASQHACLVVRPWPLSPTRTVPAFLRVQ
jgi:hypothetical protein